MKVRTLFLFLMVPFLLSITSCAHVISRDLRKQADPSLSLQKVIKNSPQQFQGKDVIWGGEIVRTTNQMDGSTLIEVLEKPLDLWEEPINSSDSQGRFLVRVPGFLDPLIYSAGLKITVAGEIQGEELMAVGETNFRYPVLLEKEIYLWPNYPTYYYSGPYPDYYTPGYYGPWYPYPFFLGFSFHGGGPHYFRHGGGGPHHSGHGGGSHHR